MLRSRTIRHSASAYFTRDYSPELPHSSNKLSWSSELEEKRIRLQRPSASSNAPFPDAKRNCRRCMLIILCVLLFCCCLLWVFRGVYYDISARLLDVYSPPSFLSTSHDVSKQLKRVESTVSLAYTKPAKHVPEEQGDTRTRRWPPMVTKIPETRPDPSLLHTGLTPSSIDAQFCGGAVPCRLLLPIWIGEQESRGRMHLGQVLQLARALNRTLVLPNVGKSRIGACGRWEFDVYYDVGSFVGRLEERDKMLVRKVMLMDDFKTWLEMRPVGPTSQMVFVDEAASGEEHYLDDASLITGDGLLDVHIDRNALDMEDPRLKKIRCLGTKFRQLRLHQHSPVTVHIPFPEGQKPLPDGNMLVKSLIRPEVGRTAFRSHVTLPDSVNDLASKVSEPEVLIVYWDIRHFPFSLGTDTLDYSSKIHKLTQRLVDPYRPYLTVHWRMETIPPFMLPDCAEALVDTLNTLLSDPTLGADIKTVWFASDFPWPVSASAASVSNDALFGSEEDDTQNYMQIASSARRSNTFRSVSHEHVEAIEIVKAAFRGGGTLEGWRLTGVTEELDRVRRDMEKEGKLYVLEEDDEEGRLLDDSGVLGILDKMAAMQAALFVSGAKRCGRVSTFTKQITESRANVWGSNVHRNVVEVFG